MIVTFWNVIISIEAESPAIAYDRLADVLGGPAVAQAQDIEYTTDTYTTHGTARYSAEQEARSTYDLWPDNRPAT